MTELTPRPDTAAVLAGLKDFQRTTVDYVFRRLYLDQETPLTHRFLIADEVGLGKTLVARGLIARTIDHLWDTVRRIDIVYICSNAEIARQNINRLNVTGRKDFSFASRITLLPLRLHDLEASKLNFISFTPGTSFDLKSTFGVAEERALLYRLLEQPWNLAQRDGELDMLAGGAYRWNFRWWVNRVATAPIASSLAQQFAHVAAGRPELEALFKELAERCEHAGGHAELAEPYRSQRRQLVGTLRLLLAETCLTVLEPDLIILDEFQRFKHLLEADDDTSQLAHRLFRYADGHSQARVVLLSATPYKMYTLSHEAGEDDHYQDFIRTISFLLDDTAELASFQRLLDDYRRVMFHLGTRDAERLRTLKQAIEDRLRAVMVRTERLAASADRDGMLREVPYAAPKLEASDLTAYVALQKIGHTLNQGDMLEYWKSAPYLLNFMDDYKVKDAFRTARHDPHRQGELARTLDTAGHLLLSWTDIAAYNALDPGNARLRALLDAMVEAGAWHMLWIPPALSYYQLEGTFGNEHGARFTKRLVFSSWKVVPKAIAALTSYEAERRMMQLWEADAENSAEARSRRSELLRLRQGGRDSPVVRSLLCLVYPCALLARECDPKNLSWDRPALDNLLERVKWRIEPWLKKLERRWKRGDTADDRWYWAAPILLDLEVFHDEARDWLAHPNPVDPVEAEFQPTDDGNDRGQWSELIAEAGRFVDQNEPLGAMPHDLLDVLALIGIAGPGVAGLRALQRVTGGPTTSSVYLRTGGAHIAWGFRTLFNMPEAMALVRGLNGGEPYWRRVLEYCAQGGIQPMLDEYAHNLRESLGLLNQPADEIAMQITRAMIDALSLRTINVGVDAINAEATTGQVEIDSRRLRCHFALRFGDERGDNGSVGTRAEQVRQAFNSPFWPFVLATTSVGQEGLDFHTYCHAIVHWNLPTNPVDLEQREGRVHRYKGHAVRKNLALRYGSVLALAEHPDPWETLFTAAREARDPDANDLVPYWLYALDGGAVIERHVPALPLSRDRERMAALRRSLAAYRMVFGQTRQEDLLAYLLQRLPPEEIERRAQELRINLEPPSPRKESTDAGA